MQITNEYDKQICKILKNLNIEHELRIYDDGFQMIHVNRTSMVNQVKAYDENENYDIVINLIQEQFPDLYICWTARTDDDIGLDIYQK